MGTEEEESPANMVKGGHRIRTSPYSPEGIAEQNNDGAHVLGFVVAANHGSRLPAVRAAGPEGENSKELKESEAPLRVRRSLKKTKTTKQTNHLLTPEHTGA